MKLYIALINREGFSARGVVQYREKGQMRYAFYNTEWNWLHKLRRAMVCPGRDRLTGVVEVDETYVGGVGTGTRGRGTERKSIVAIAVEVRSDGWSGYNGVEKTGYVHAATNY